MFDYSKSGGYFITICTQDRKCTLSRIVGRGFTPAAINEVVLTKYGKVAQEQLMLLEKRYCNVKVDRYVIMPDHIHVVFILNDLAGASPRPTIMDIVCAYKSLVTRECKKHGFVGKLFQTSFYEHIIRNRDDYDACVRYIAENPSKL